MDELPGPGTVSLVLMCRPLLIYKMAFGHSYHLISVHFRHDDILDCYDVFHIFPVPASPISLRPCHCTCLLSCGCVGLSVRR